MQFSENNDRITWFLRFVTFLLVVAILQVAEDVLLPIAFAILLAFLLSPLVIKLMRWGLPRAVAIILTVTVSFGVIGAVGWLVTAQAISLVRELPNYEENIRQKIVTLKTPQTPGVVARMSGMLENLRRELKAPAEKSPTSTSTAPVATKPVPVEVTAVERSSLELASEIVSPILRPLGTAGIVIVFVIAILFQREDLRDRFITLVSAGKLNVATQALDDAAGRVSRYLGMQLVVNAAYGIPIGVGLFFIGIPNALLWGLLATLLRFVPFVGPWIAAIFPVALSLAVDPGWSKLFYTLGLFMVMELVSNNIIEVVLYGASTGISNFALLVAAVFWTWLWGPAGLVLSTPLTVCLLVLGTYVPGMAFLSMLLGSQPVLDPPAQFYQRMLSMESEDMIDLAVKHVHEHSIEDFYEQVFVPALLLSEEDRHSGALTDARQQFIFQASRELIEELERQDEAARLATLGADKAQHSEPATLPARPVALGIPARDEADEIVGSMLCHLLRRRGIAAATTPFATSLSDAFAAANQSSVRALFISGLPPSAVGAARQMCRRLKTAVSNKPVLVGVWSHRANLDELENRLQGSRPDEVVTNLSDAIAQLEAMISQIPTTPPLRNPPEPPASKHERVIADDNSRSPFEAVT